MVVWWQQSGVQQCDRHRKLRFEITVRASNFNQSMPTANTLTAYIFANGLSPTLPNGDPFNGFDGMLFRGQIDNTGGNTPATAYNGELFVLVTLQDGTKIPFTYTDLSDKNDFGVLGFDERPGVEELVKSVFISVNDPNETDALGLNAMCLACGPKIGPLMNLNRLSLV
jgi:hypothetical protein